ncbi:cilia- and flagella-associated protein 43 [Spodoptera frugiperda]|uniref:Cilia- and flagella-associated protein 43 n=1 Tax=Spodoptera frugiperda TaxID=7108 RepID=A0A9R0DAM0_SPOFR|nr:cilia- and flagella-associated protein 43 [Spodoptera frugiperda]
MPDEVDDAYEPKVRWVNPQRLDLMTFIGKEVFVVAHDIYIIIFNYKTNTEMVYVANNQERGDGVDVLGGHRSYMFAFAEKVRYPRVFIIAYPSLSVVAELKDMDVNRYKGICMMESDLIATFTGFPNYLVNVWCWRTNQRLLSIPTGVYRRKQIFMASRTHMLIGQCWGEGVNVWEVARCYKKCFMLRRKIVAVGGWDAAEQPLMAGICWSLEGQLYSIDCKANLYGLASDGVALVKTLEWSDDKIEGNRQTHICAFLNGLLFYGPDDNLRFLRKEVEGKSWKVEWTHVPMDVVVRLVSNAFCDMVTMWTSSGFVYKITADAEDKIEVNLFTVKQRNIKKIQLIAPDFKHLVMMNDNAIISIYELYDQKLIFMKAVKALDVSFKASPVDPLIAIFGEVNGNYGIALQTFEPETGLKKQSRMCLTHQIVSRVAFSECGRFLVAAAMSAGHIFIFKVSTDYKLNLMRYTEFGRGLADCFLMQVGATMRCFSLVLFSEKYSIGERIICVNAETGKDNKFAGKMQGPYSKLLPLSTKDTMIAIPHLSRQMHILRLNGDKGVTVSVKMGPIIESGHDIKQFSGFRGANTLMTFGYDGTVILRSPEAPVKYDLKLIVTHRYEYGVKSAVVDEHGDFLIHLAVGGTMACTFLRKRDQGFSEFAHTAPSDATCKTDDRANIISIIHYNEKNYLDIQEIKKVNEEAMDYKRQREEVVKVFEVLQSKLVELLEENINERPLHQLSLSEFNLHQEAKKERLKAAEKEREEIRLHTEARIRAQDKVTAWIKQTCWDTIQTPRIKLFAIFSHYHVENFAMLPSQRETWAELQQIEALRSIEMENDSDLFRPWLEQTTVEPPTDSAVIVPVAPSISTHAESMASFRDNRMEGDEDDVAVDVVAEPYVLSGTNTHRFVSIPHFMIPQMEAYSFLQMNWLYHIVQLNTQNMRMWFNKQFEELMQLKKREVALVAERNDRLRFIIEELNKLSDLRGSFHHLKIEIKDPQWRQEEHVEKLIKVEPEECSIEPYISPSQIVIVPPDPGPKDDFRERALIEMMDGVLEKLWHEEIKKPIPMPQCMLDKDPENFNEEDLRQVFDYEAKVKFRNEERDKYRKMLHAEYAKLSQVLNEGIVKFNQKVRDTWLTKIKVDSVIGQENLNLMRLRRTNLDRIVMSEIIEDIRDHIALYERQLEELNAEFQAIQDQSLDCQAAYEALTAKDRQMDKTFKNHFSDISPIIVDQAYKFFKRRPKWHQRVTMIPVVLYELALAVATGTKPPLLHPDCFDYFKGMEQLDQISNMPTVMDEHMWATMCKLRRAKTENEIRMRALIQEMTYVDSAISAWNKAIQARRTFLVTAQSKVAQHRETVELEARNKTVQLVLPAGQVEIITTGHIEDFDDATLIPKVDIETINNLILKVGAMKLRMMRKQMEFRKGILAKEWEHAQMLMKLRHMKQELYSYQRLKIPKELQLYLKNKELGYTDEQDYVKMEKENEASKLAVNKILNEQIHRTGEIEVKLMNMEAAAEKIEKLITNLNVKVSEKRLNEDALEPIRQRRVYKKRMETLVMRSRLIRDVQANHCTIVMLQTELELLRLKTYPTLASFRTY